MLVDCAKECSGCGGGLRDAAYRFVIKNGLKKESEYPYVARD